MINLRVHGNLILCGISNQTFGISKGNLYLRKSISSCSNKIKKAGIILENKLENQQR